MTTDLLHHLRHDTGWNLIAAATLLTLGLALAVLAYTAGSHNR